MTQWLMKQLAGREKFQNIFRSLLRLSLEGMNYGNVKDIRQSGEWNVFHTLKQYFKKREHVSIFDVGGNLGSYSQALAEYFGRRATIYAFEPSAKTYQQFVANTKDIKVIRPNNVGFSDREERTLLYMDHEMSTLASVYPRNLHHYDIDVAQVEEVNLTTIDHYCEENQIAKIDFLKLDVEGHELKALRGAERMINKDCIDFIQFEFGGCNIDSRTFFQDFFYLLNERYRIFRIVRNGLIEIKKYEELDEIFRTINYFAQHRRCVA